jgi:hypothetical protein
MAVFQEDSFLFAIRRPRPRGRRRKKLSLLKNLKDGLSCRIIYRRRANRKSLLRMQLIRRKSYQDHKKSVKKEKENAGPEEIKQKNRLLRNSLIV